MVGRRVENMNDDPSSFRVGGVSPTPRALSRKLMVTSRRVVAKCTHIWTMF